VLLHGGLGEVFAKLLDVGRDHHRLDAAELVNAPGLKPGEKHLHGVDVGPPGVLLPDVGGEELEEAPGAVFAGRGDDDRDAVEACPGERL